eukprot:3809815-Rhodomonas_salina.1
MCIRDRAGPRAHFLSESVTLRRPHASPGPAGLFSPPPRCWARTQRPSSSRARRLGQPHLKSQAQARTDSDLKRVSLPGHVSPGPGEPESESDSHPTRSRAPASLVSAGTELEPEPAESESPSLSLIESMPWDSGCNLKIALLKESYRSLWYG